MSKNTFAIFAFALAALTSGAFAQQGGTVALDVIIRDFKSNVGGYGMPGFEERDQERSGNRQCAERTDQGAKSNDDTKENGICFGATSASYHSCDKGGTQLVYGGSLNGPIESKYGQKYNSKGLWNGPDVTAGTKPEFVIGGGTKGKIKPANNTNGGSFTTGVYKTFDCDGDGCEWTQDVFVTRGMVQKKLDYSECEKDPSKKVDGETEAIRGRYCARPMPANGKCYGGNLQDWYTDVPQAKRKEEVLEFQNVSGTIYKAYYGSNKPTDWGCGYTTPGFFPLDKYNCSSTENAETWGTEDCMQWPPTQSCSHAERKHNYNFSVAGSGEFKYNAGSNDMFKFVGDDDMWIFIDGELFEDPETGAHADLGGVHLGAPAVIDINRLATRLGWKEGSPHAINFFYAERGVDDSNLYLEMSLSGLKPPRFGAPYIMEVTTIQSTDGTSTTTIYVNNKLDRDHFNKLIRGDEWGEKFPIIMHKAGQNDLWGFKFSEAIGEPVDAGSKGYAYTIVGTLCKTSTDCSPSYSFNSGDSLSFNIVGWEEIANGRFIDHGFVLSPNVEDDWLLIRSEAGNKANKLAWGRNTTKLPPIKFEPDVVDKDPKKPPFNIDQWFTGDPNGGPGSGGIGNVGAGDFGGGGDFPKITWIWDPKTGTMEKMEADKGKNDGTVHGFGGKGSPIPPSRAGELILTSYPNSGNEGYAEWLKNDEAQRLFGVPPKVKGPSEPFGVADPSVEQPTGGYMFVKNGFPGESSVGTVKVAPTRCVQDGDPEKPKINCLNFSLVAMQPFKLAVTVYDQLGNFVTQYREEVTEQEFRSAVQAPTYLPGFTSNYSDQCREPDISKEGSANGDFGKPDMAVANGMVKVNVNVYPFAADGRRFGNGVYILKIDRVDMPYEGCVNMAGNQSFMGKESFPFVRYHADMKYGWMRSAGGSNENGNKNQDNPAAKRGRWF